MDIAQMDTNTAPLNLDERPTFKTTIRSIDEGYLSQAFRICITAVCTTTAEMCAAENAGPENPQNHTLRHIAINKAHQEADQAAWSALMCIADAHTALQIAEALKALA